MSNCVNIIYLLLPVECAYGVLLQTQMINKWTCTKSGKRLDNEIATYSEDISKGHVPN